MEVETVAVKLVIVGDGAVGKTCMLSWFIHFYAATERTGFLSTISPPSFRTASSPSKFSSRSSIWDSGTYCGIQGYCRTGIIWKTAAPSLLQCWCLSPHLLSGWSVLLQPHLEKGMFLFSKWVPEVKMVNPSAVIVVVGNKIDLRDERYNNPSIVKAEEGLR